MHNAHSASRERSRTNTVADYACVAGARKKIARWFMDLIEEQHRCYMVAALLQVDGSHSQSKLSDMRESLIVHLDSTSTV